MTGSQIHRNISGNPLTRGESIQSRILPYLCTTVHCKSPFFAATFFSLLCSLGRMELQERRENETHMQTWTSLPAWRPKSPQSYAQTIFPLFPTVISQPDRKCMYRIQVKTESPLSCIQSPFLPPNHLNAYYVT